MRKLILILSLGLFAALAGAGESPYMGQKVVKPQRWMFCNLTVTKRIRTGGARDIVAYTAVLPRAADPSINYSQEFTDFVQKTYHIEKLTGTCVVEPTEAIARQMIADYRNGAPDWHIDLVDTGWKR